MSQQHPTRFFLNGNSAGIGSNAGLPSSAPREFHQRLPGYAPTPLINAPALARTLGIGQLLIKDESRRLGLPAFKILGASWGIYRALEARLGRSLEPWRNIDELTDKLGSL